MFTRDRKSFNPFGVEVGKVSETNDEKAFWNAIDTSNLPREKNPKYDLRTQYRKLLEGATIASLALVLLVFQWFRNVQMQEVEFEKIVHNIEVEEIPLTQQVHRTPPPQRPQMVMPSDDESIPEEETIAATEFSFENIPDPPPPPKQTDDSSSIFVAYDVPPIPLDGWNAIYKYIEYPEIAKLSGVEGRVFLKVLVNEQGIVEDAVLLKGCDSNVGLEEAAVAAAFKVKWHPAQQRDRAIKVWVGYPVTFVLKETDGP
ncbi:MAG: TonB family protein [Deferribacteres bacterium]|nr:TonB family protein [candidate division KSB1 bacterium]MCB9512035.1 TonB family protein [Deferribacteres bacterium]